MQIIAGVEFYDLEEVASQLNRDDRTVYRYIMDGKLTASKVGGTWLVRKEDLLKFVAPVEIKGGKNA